jgi:hypothetical protein
MACGNNLVVESNIQAQPTAPSHPIPGRADTGMRQQAVAAAQQANRQIANAQQAVQRAATEQAVKSALKDAEKALDAARRGSRDPKTKAALRTLDRHVDQLRRDAAKKTGDIAGREHHEREQHSRAAASAAAAPRDHLAPMHLGVVQRAAAPKSGGADGEARTGANWVPTGLEESQLRIDREEALASTTKGIGYDALKPNTKYIWNDQVYVTDSHGLPAFAAGELTLDRAARQSEGSNIGQTGRFDDIGFHLIGAQFGGFGSGPNLIAGNVELNRNRVDKPGQAAVGIHYGTLEATWRTLLECGARVFVEISLVGSEAHPSRPDGVQVNFRVERTPETSFDRYPPDQWTGWEAYLDGMSTAYFENEAP